jgi:hypothetical protein
MTLLQRIGALILALAAVAVFFVMAPTDNGTAERVSEVLAEATLNENGADSAPQQQVVNGWAARDLLAIIARQQGDDRVPALACLLVLGVALAIFTSPRRTSAPDGVQSDVAHRPSQQDRTPARLSADWYTDREDSSLERWHNGAQWTDATRPRSRP